MPVCERGKKKRGEVMTRGTEYRGKKYAKMSFNNWFLLRSIPRTLTYETLEKFFQRKTEEGVRGES